MAAPFKLQDGFLTKPNLRKKYDFLSLSEFNSILDACTELDPDGVIIVHWANGSPVYAYSPNFITIMGEEVEKKTGVASPAEMFRSRKRYLDYVYETFGDIENVSPSGIPYVNPEESYASRLDNK